MDRRSKTIFCDIDGTLTKHILPQQATDENYSLELLDGTIEKLWEWDRLGYTIILTTGRKESLREPTEKQLRNAGIFYDKLIMGIGGGDRILINDKKPDGRETAFSFNISRNEGIKDINI